VCSGRSTTEETVARRVSSQLISWTRLLSTSEPRPPRGAGEASSRKPAQARVVGGHSINFGFQMNAAGDGYEVDEEKMPLVRRVFRMVAEEGLARFFGCLEQSGELQLQGDVLRVGQSAYSRL
jgi:hypothetical protein